jgi:hypothetical protein
MSGAPWRVQRVRGTGSPPVSHSSRTSFPTTAIRTGAGRRTKYGGSETQWDQPDCGQGISEYWYCASNFNAVFLCYYNYYEIFWQSTINFCFIHQVLRVFCFYKISAGKTVVPDPAFFLIADPDPGFWWPKIGKNLQQDIFIYFFLIKIAIYLSLSLPKGRPSYRRSLQPQKGTSSTSKHENSSLFSFFGHFCPPGSESGSSNSY